MLLTLFHVLIQTDTPSITAKLINEQKEDKEKKNHEEKEKMKADSGFQDNYSVVVASGTWNLLVVYLKINFKLLIMNIIEDCLDN